MRSSSLTSHSQSTSRLPTTSLPLHETPSKNPNHLESFSQITATSSHNKSARHLRTSSLAGNPAIQDLISYQPPSLNSSQRFSSHKRGASFNQDSSRLERSASTHRINHNSIFSDSNEASIREDPTKTIRNFSQISLADIAQLKRDILSGQKSTNPSEVLLTSYQANHNINPIPIIINPFNKGYETNGSKKSDSIQTAPYFPEPKQLATEDQLPTDFEFDISQSILEDTQGKIYEESPAILQKIIQEKLTQKPVVKQGGGIPTFNLDIFPVSNNNNEQPTSFGNLPEEHKPQPPTKPTHTRSLSSQPAMKRENMAELKICFNKKKMTDAPVPEIHNKVYDINEILAEVEKLEKLVSEEDARAPLSNPQRNKTKYDLPRQIPPLSQRTQRTTEPLFCDESTINYNTQSGTLATSPSKFDKRTYKIGLGDLNQDSSNSLIDFTLKTEPKLSDRSQGGTSLALSARVQKVLKRIEDRSKIAEIAINSSRSLLSFNKTSIPEVQPQPIQIQNQNLSNVYSFGARTPTSNQGKETGRSLSQPRSSFEVSQEVQKVREKLEKYKAVIEPQHVPEFCDNTQSLEDTLGKREESGVECYDASQSFIKQESTNKPAYYLAAPKLIQSQKSVHRSSSPHLPHNNPFKKKESAPPSNPDLIAHIEYNYQPPNPIIPEESPEKTSIITPKNASNASVVNVCATLDEIAFASPNRLTAPAKAADLDYIHKNIINKIHYVHSDILKRISEISGKIDQPPHQNDDDFVPSFNYQIPAQKVSHSSKPNTRQSSMDFQYDYIQQNQQVPVFPVNLLQPSAPSTKRNNHSRNSSMGGNFEENNLPTMDSLQQKAREILDHVTRKSRESTPQASQRQISSSQKINPASSSRRSSAQQQQDYYYPHNQSNPLQDREKLDNIKSIKCSPRMDAVLKSTANYFDQGGAENMYQRQGKYKEMTVNTYSKNKQYIEPREKYSKPTSPVKKSHHQRSKTSFTGNNSSLNMSSGLENTKPSQEKNLLRQKIESKLAEGRFREQQPDYYNIGSEATPGSINQFTQSTTSDLMQDLLSISNILGIKKGPKEPTRMHEKVALNNNVLKTCRKIATTGGASVGKFKENDLRPEGMVNWPNGGGSKRDTHVEKCLYDMVKDRTGKFGVRK